MGATVFPHRPTRTGALTGACVPPRPPTVNSPRVCGRSVV
jgi:hypothetical protein